MLKRDPRLAPSLPSVRALASFCLAACLLMTGCKTIEDDPGVTHQGGTAALAAGVERSKEFKPVVGKRGGTRVISSVSLPKTFNAYLAAETSSTDVIGQMYVGLVSTDPVTTEIKPVLAESWELSEDKRSYTFKLREGLKWSDGQPITVDDVVFTYKEIVDNKDIPNNYRDGLLVEDQFPVVEKVDERHVRFTTVKPFVPFLRGLSDPIMPKHAFEGTTRPDKDGKVKFNSLWGLDVAAKNPDIIVCNGPWKLSQYRPGQHVVLEPNPNYYLKDEQGNSLPYLDKFITIEVQDLSTEIIKFQARETDALALRAEDYDILEPLRERLNFSIDNLGPATGTLFVMFNMSTAKTPDGKPVVNPVKSAWFRNPKFRQAMAHALNTQGMIESIYKGRAIPQTSHISQQNPFYKPNVKTYPYDIAKAAALLEEAGFRKNANGELFDAKGNRVEFDLVTNSGNTQRDAACSIIRKDWDRLGIKVNYRPIQFNVMVQQIDQTLDWDAMMIGLTGSAIEPHFGINTWKLDGRMHMFNMGHSSRWKGQPTTFDPWEKEILDLYEKAAVEFDPEKRKQLYWRSQDLVSEYLPFLYTTNQLAMVAVRKDIGNVFPTIHGGSGLSQINWNTDYHFLTD